MIGHFQETGTDVHFSTKMFIQIFDITESPILFGVGQQSCIYENIQQCIKESIQQS